ncbi:hypothetical protein V6N13_130121 [Hibiscus sabdariffa]|uniref:Uncharacterized protein n=1 Tax=Hibiscus sabdariffa TaxID=183260 RepID=A0ABR2SN76_9ROSI
MSTTAESLVAKRLEGKVVLITGGASGIGESTARLFVKHGAKVLIADVQDELGQSLCKELGTEDIINYVHCDVTCETDVRNSVDLEVSRYGKLDIMYNNAGIAGDAELRAADTDGDNFKKVLDVNVLGPFLGAKHAARVMIPAKTGCILFTASVVSLAYLGEHGIRVNCISPYAIPTPLLVNLLDISDKRKAEETISTNGVLRGTVLETEDIAKAALFLASDEAKYVSGVNLPVDGAYTLDNQTWKVGL